MLLGTAPVCPVPVGRVLRVDRGSVLVGTVPGTDAPRRLTPSPHGAAVGDWLALPPDDPPWLLPRTSLLARAAASGASTAQPLAANVDTVLICAAAVPDPSLRRLERLLALVWESGATPVVVLTKADLHREPAAVIEAVLPHAPGVDVVAVSAAAGDTDALEPYLTPGATVVLLGASGAGKSTLLNGLAGADVAATQAVRDVDGKGRHTTSSRELFVLPGGAVVIDTPGLRGVALHDAHDGVARAFVDVEELASACRFADCEHRTEPGCAVLASVEAGDLSQERLDSWRKLQREVAWHERRTDARLQAEERNRWKAIHRAQRSRGGRP